MGSHPHRRTDAELRDGPSPPAGLPLTALVVDASAVLYAASDPRGFEPLARFDLVAPPLMWSEATSALRELVWRGVASKELGGEALRSLMAAPIERRSPRRLHQEAWKVAGELGWAKTYDAEYVALARMLGSRLLTRDARLQHGAARLIEIVGPTDL